MVTMDLVKCVGKFSNKSIGKPQKVKLKINGTTIVRRGIKVSILTGNVTPSKSTVRQC
tara:strand:+ start:30856 stop:31029 length:174 start_codon:yes stop_codon:yes gene_type:complete